MPVVPLTSSPASRVDTLPIAAALPAGVTRQTSAATLPHSRSCPKPYECQDAFPPAFCRPAALSLLCAAASFPGASSCRVVASCGLHQQLAVPSQVLSCATSLQRACQGSRPSFRNGFACTGALWRTGRLPPLLPSMWLPAVGDEGHAAFGCWKASSLKAASSLKIQLWSCHSGRSASPAPLAGFGFAFERPLQIPVSYTHLTLPTSDLV